MAPRFEDLIERHHDEIFSYLWRLLGKQRCSRAEIEVEDVTQEVFLRAYRAFPFLRPESNHRAWLYKIATNCAFTELRRLKRRRDEARSLRDHAASANSRFHGGSTGESLQLSSLLGELPVKQRACVTLRYFQDLDYAEIAAMMHCTEASARANVYQAIRRLRRALEEQR
jgi:RNA polymerase sigma-70 factor (ECF subfamily)